MNKHTNTEIESVDNVALLSPMQLAAIPLLATGAKIRAVAAQLGIHPNTITRWARENEAFKEELDKQTREIYQSGLRKALVVLDEHLEAGSRLEQFRAANARLQYDAQLQRAHVNVDVTHTVVDKLRGVLQGTDEETIEAEYRALADGKQPEPI